jgi:hypothetical protein
MAESRKRQDLLVGIIQSLTGWLQKIAPAIEFDCCDASEIERLAREAGLNERELRALAATPAGASILLNRRLAILHLDPANTERIHSAVLRDLQIHCTMCGSKKRCAGDLASGTLDSTWQDYCPNTHTLRSLIAEAPAPATIEDVIIYLNTVGNEAYAELDESNGRNDTLKH